MSLLFITSPAKSLDESKDWMNYSPTPSLPMHVSTATKIAFFLKEKSLADLKSTLQVSDSLAKLNFERMKNWEAQHTVDTSKPALLLYNGAVYKEMTPKEYTKKEQEYAQNHIRIISGFYGLLRPYDLIQPYRLEMKTPIELTGNKSLANYWSEKITSGLNTAVEENQATAIINLASQEYSSAVNQKDLTVPFISVDFKEEKNGKLRTIAIYAKKARGAMMEYAVKNNVRSFNQLKEANILGHIFSSDSKSHLLYIRKK